MRFVRLAFICGRLVDCILGPGACARDRRLSGNPLVVLGVEVTLDHTGAKFMPSRDKLFKWSLQMQQYLESGILHAGPASKLAGGLVWGGQKMFRKLGRAMIRPIFRHVLVSMHPISLLSLRAALP